MPAEETAFAGVIGDSGLGRSDWLRPRGGVAQTRYRFREIGWPTSRRRQERPRTATMASSLSASWAMRRPPDPTPARAPNLLAPERLNWADSRPTGLHREQPESAGDQAFGVTLHRLISALSDFPIFSCELCISICRVFVAQRDFGEAQTHVTGALCSLTTPVYRPGPWFPSDRAASKPSENRP
jgi:hypothetical protein